MAPGRDVFRGIIYIKKERYKVIPAVYVILIKDEAVLLLRRFQTGYCDGQYTLPAGHIEKNETPIDAAIREAKEEIGVELKATDLEFQHVMDRKCSDRDYVDFFFVAKSWKGVPTNNEPQKCDDLLWVSVDKLPESTISYIKHALDNIKEKTFYSHIRWH